MKVFNQKGELKMKKAPVSKRKGDGKKSVKVKKIIEPNSEVAAPVIIEKKKSWWEKWLK